MRATALIAGSRSEKQPVYRKFPLGGILRLQSSQAGFTRPVGVWTGSKLWILKGRTIWIVDAHRDDGRRFIVRSDDILTAFVELEREVLTVTFYLESIHASDQ